MKKTDPALRWTDRLASHNGDWSGNLYDFYNKVYQRIAVDLKKPFRLDGIYRIDDTPVHVAVREAMANCLSNADYYLKESVKIEKYPDRIVLSNPGTITLGKKQMLRGGKSRPRNKVILNMLNYIGVGERAGSGVPNIYAIWEQEGYVEPTVDEMSGREDTIITVVTLPLVKKEQSLEISEKQPEKSPEKQPEETRSAKIEMRVAAVLDLIRNDPTLSRAAIARKLEITDSQARTAIDKLKERGKIHREGSDTDGKWIIDFFCHEKIISELQTHGFSPDPIPWIEEQVAKGKIQLFSDSKILDEIDELFGSGSPQLYYDMLKTSCDVKLYN